MLCNLKYFLIISIFIIYTASLISRQVFIVKTCLTKDNSSDKDIANIIKSGRLTKRNLIFHANIYLWAGE